MAPYEELVARWYRSKGGTSSAISEGELPVPEVLIKQHGTPQENPDFWDSLSANAYASNLSGPVQLHHGTADTDVPASFSDLYYKEIIAAGQTAEFYLYAGDDHNLSGSFEIAMRRTLAFLDAHVKNVAPMLSQIQTSSPAQLVP